MPAFEVYSKMPLICVYAFEHMWYTKQGNDCKWAGQQTADDLASELLSS